MPATATLRTAVALVALACAGIALAQPGMGRGGAPKTFIAGTGPDDMWEITTKMQMGGMSMPAETQQACFKKGRNVGEASVPKQDNCRITEMKSVGNKTTFAMECTGEEPMSMRGETTATPTSFDSRMTMKSTRRGGTEMTMTSSGRRTGACTDQSEKVMASMKAEGDAQVAKMCAEGVESLNYTMFGAGSPCAPRKQALCDKAAPMVAPMRDPATYRTAVGRHSPIAVKGTFDLCGLDYAGTVKSACTKAAGAKNWGFVGNGLCDAEVMANGPTYCKGRDYYLVDRSLTSLCNRYAAVTRGGGATAAGAGGAAGGTAAAGASGGTGPASAGTARSGQAARTAEPAQAAEAPKPDPVKQGVDAVRRLLPF